MSTQLELVVRRERAIFTPSYHVTVASTDPMIVVEAFDIRTNEGMSAAAEAAMVQLRAKGYRLTEAIVEHDSALGGQYATARLARDEREAATIVLAGDLIQDARQMVKALSAMDSPAGAREVARLATSLVANAQALKARAEAVLSSDAQVEAAAVYEDVVANVDGGVS